MQREEDQTIRFGFYSKYRGVDSGFKDGSMTSSDINFKIILQLLCRNGVEGSDRNWVHRGAAYFGGVCTPPPPLDPAVRWRAPRHPCAGSSPAM